LRLQGLPPRALESFAISARCTVISSCSRRRSAIASARSVSCITRGSSLRQVWSPPLRARPAGPADKCSPSPVMSAARDIFSAVSRRCCLLGILAAGYPGPSATASFSPRGCSVSSSACSS
jgi:hypothetical protein